MQYFQGFDLSTASTSLLVDLHALKLGDARALLEHSAQTLPDSKSNPTSYLQALIDKLSELSLKDPLTGLANRRYFQSVLAREIEMVARTGEPALLLMLDIDHFKNVNDTHGHPVGDVVLQNVAKALAKCVRPMDTVARFGGEEFVIILPSCQGAYGQQVAERIRETVGALALPLATGEQLKVTISIGGAYAPRWVRSTPELWIDRADSELYRAKAEGRNRVCIEAQPMLCVSAEEKNLLFGPLALGDPAWIESIANDGTASPIGAASKSLN